MILLCMSSTAQYQQLAIWNKTLTLTRSMSHNIEWLWISISNRIYHNVILNKVAWSKKYLHRKSVYKHIRKNLYDVFLAQQALIGTRCPKSEHQQVDSFDITHISQTQCEWFDIHDLAKTVRDIFTASLCTKLLTFGTFGKIAPYVIKPLAKNYWNLQANVLC